ncbi:MAG: M16 family metallopeptidase [Candidatus Saccharimonadales bacterium]
MKHSVEEVVLGNGSRGLLIHVPNATVTSYDFEFRAGNQYARAEDVYETPHIMEHMVFGANQTYKSSLAFKAEFQKNGAHYNASTADTSLRYYTTCADFEWDRINDLLRLAITKPMFLDSEFQAESGNVKEELTGYLNSHNRVLWQRLAQASGEKFLTDSQRLKVMDNVKLDDIKEHYKRTHTSDNMRFVIAGNLKEERRNNLLDSLEKWQLSRGERFAVQKEELVGSPEPVRVSRKEVESLIFALSIQANWRLKDSEHDSMNALNHMLTGTLHSLILGKARERGLTYGMWSDVLVSESTSAWEFGGQVSLKNAPKLFEIIVEEVQKIRTGKIKNEDIDAAKQFALGKHQMGCQTVGAIVQWYGGRYFFDGYVDDYMKRPKAIEAINKEAIVKAANDFIGGKRWALGGLGQCSEEQLKDLHQQVAVLFE